MSGPEPGRHADVPAARPGRGRRRHLGGSRGPQGAGLRAAARRGLRGHVAVAGDARASGRVVLVQLRAPAGRRLAGLPRPHRHHECDRTTGPILDRRRCDSAPSGAGLGGGCSDLSGLSRSFRQRRPFARPARSGAVGCDPDEPQFPGRRPRRDCGACRPPRRPRHRCRLPEPDLRVALESPLRHGRLHGRRPERSEGTRRCAGWSPRSTATTSGSSSMPRSITVIPGSSPSPTLSRRAATRHTRRGLQSANGRFESATGRTCSTRPPTGAAISIVSATRPASRWRRSTTRDL